MSPQEIVGFTLQIRHSELGIQSQVREVRVVGVTTDSKGSMMSSRQLMRFIVPKTKNGAELSYDFPSVSSSNLFTFEFLSNYGSPEQVPPKITLYTRQ